MSQTFDVIIIGGGAIGCTAAFFLTKAGLSVGLFDKGQMSREASWASAGMVGPSAAPGFPWYQETTTLSKSLYDELNDELYHITNRRIGYGGNGMLTIASTESEAHALRQEHRHLQTSQIDSELLTGAEARKQEPALPENTLAALWAKDKRYLDARLYTEVIADAAQQLGVRRFPGTPVTGLLRNNNTITGVQTPTNLFCAGTTINAAGAWAGQIDPQLTIPVAPLHGQMMALSAPPTGLRHNIMKVGFWGYATPRDDGRVLIGATEDEWGYQKKVTPTGLAFLSDVTQTLLPILAESELLDTWSGLRPASPDGLPIIGPDPRVDGGFLWATGHTASGMMQAPATGVLLTDLITHNQSPISFDQVRINRFL